jgi:hypothetical protein
MSLAAPMWPAISYPGAMGNAAVLKKPDTPSPGAPGGNADRQKRQQRREERDYAEAADIGPWTRPTPGAALTLLTWPRPRDMRPGGGTASGGCARLGTGTRC